MVEQHSFIIPISRLQEKLEKHTSTIGKYRSSEEAAHLMERFALTMGEDFLFEDYLPEAATKTFNWIKAFSRNLPDGYNLYHNVKVREVHEQDALHISLDGMDFDGKIAAVHIREDMYNVEEAEGENRYRITVRLPHLCIHKGDAGSFSFAISVAYRTLADGTFEDRFIHQETMWSQEDVDIDEYSFYTHVSQDDFPTEISGVDGLKLVVLDETPAVAFRKGEFIELVMKDGTHHYGIQDSDGNKLDVKQWFSEDIRDSIVFKVELPDWQDRNMLPAAADALEWAIADYIMYRWFETVQEPSYYRGRKVESLRDIFLTKWEEKVREAQLALNSERRILQRKSTWL